MWDYISISIKKFITEHGLYRFGRYYSVYRGTVHNNEDPDGLGRLIINVPFVHGDDIPDNWAWPMCPPGDWKPPQKGDPVYVQFEEGDVRYPIWNFGWWNVKSRMPKNADNDIQIWESLAGNRISMSNKTGDVVVETKDKHKVEFSSGDILFTTKQGMKVKLDDIVTIGTGLNGVLLSNETLVELLKVKAFMEAIKTLCATAPSILEPGNNAPSVFAQVMNAALASLETGKFDTSIVSNKMKIQ